MGRADGIDEAHINACRTVNEYILIPHGLDRRHQLLHVPAGDVASRYIQQLYKAIVQDRSALDS